jgi:hypothetical protein
VTLCALAGVRPAAREGTAGRPDINWLNRSEEDWSVLAFYEYKHRVLNPGTIDSREPAR